MEDWRHSLIWINEPQGVARLSDWGYRAGCTCGWAQTPRYGLLGTEERATLEWQTHIAAISISEGWS